MVLTVEDLEVDLLSELQLEVLILLSLGLLLGDLKDINLSLEMGFLSFEDVLLFSDFL